MPLAPPPSLPSGPSPLSRILLSVGVLGIIGAAAWALTDDAAGPRFIQVGLALGSLVYLATFVDILLGLAFLILCIGFSPEVSVGGLDQLRLEDFIVPALLFGWLARASRLREPIGPLRIAGPAAFYFAAMCFSTLVGLALGTTTTKAALSFLAKNVEYFTLFLVFVCNVRTAAEFRALVVVAVGAAAVYGATGLAGGGRVQGPESETATIYGGYLALHLVMAVGFFLHASTPGTRFLWIAAACLIAVAVSRTLSRTTYAATGAALVAFGLLRERRVLGLVAAGTMAALFLLPEGILAKMATIGDVATGAGPSSWQSRVYSWELTFARLNGPDFAFGRGLGSVALGEVDNEYVHILADSGLAGLICFVVLLGRYAREVDRGYRLLPPGGFHKGAAAGFWMATALMCVHAIGATSFTSIRTMEAFIVLAGLAVAQANHARDWGLLPEEEAPIPSKPDPRAPMPVVLLPPPAR